MAFGFHADGLVINQTYFLVNTLPTKVH